MARRKRHHTVTRAVLEGFSQGGRVIARSREGLQFPQAIQDATVVADFYSFDNDGRPDDAVEDWLAAVVEQDFTDILPGLRQGGQPTSTMGPAIARFLAAAVVRTRTARSYLDQIDRHIAGTVVLWTIAPRMGWNLAEMSRPQVAHLRDLCQQAWQSLPPRPDPEASHLRTIVRQSRQIEQSLSTYAWSVARTEEPAFLIGDAPVLALDGRTRGWHGLIPKGAAVFLPLSPQAVLIGEPHIFNRSSSAAGIAATVNTLTVREAHQYVFRHPEMEWPPDLRLSTQPPSLPRPSFNIRPSQPGRPPTYPYTYPVMDDAETTTLLNHLKAIDVVE